MNIVVIQVMEFYDWPPKISWFIRSKTIEIYGHLTDIVFMYTRKHPLRGCILDPSEGLRAPELPKVSPGGRSQESVDDSKAI